MNKILIVIDMQNDFITGTLGTPEAVKIVPNVINKIKWARENNYRIIFTKDTHSTNYFKTQEGRFLPVAHCLYNTKGADIPKEILDAAVNYEVFHKETFGSTDMAQYLYRDYMDTEPVDEIILTGVCTDVCVISNAMLLKAYFPETKIIADANCCAGSNPENHRKALDIMKCCQIFVEERMMEKKIYKIVYKEVLTHEYFVEAESEKNAEEVFDEMVKEEYIRFDDGVVEESHIESITEESEER